MRGQRYFKGREAGRGVVKKPFGHDIVGGVLAEAATHASIWSLGMRRMEMVKQPVLP